jgi:hypothetical protein
MKLKKWQAFCLLILGMSFFGGITGIIGCSQKATPISPPANLDANKVRADQEYVCPFPCGCDFPCSGPDFCSPTPYICTPVTTPPTPVPTETFTATVSPSPSPTPTQCSPLAHQILLEAFKQSDSRWKYVLMPDDKTASPAHTIGSIGCLLTCYSMMDGRDPHQLDDLFTGLGLIEQNGNLNFRKAIYFLHNVLFQYLAVTQIEVDETFTFDISSDIDVFVASPNNQYVIAEILNMNTGVTHYIQITGKTFNPGIKKCDYTIFDPAARNYQYLSQYNTLPYTLFALIGITGF